MMDDVLEGGNRLTFADTVVEHNGAIHTLVRKLGFAQ